MNKYTTAKEYGLRCRRFRQLRNMSQQQLADELHITPQAISKYEKNGISDIEMIQQISNVLGYNLQSDEIDEEGKVGEVGKEILSLLVRNEGWLYFNELTPKLYGMDIDRVTHEIFKLMRIGLVVREQFVGFDDLEHDVLFISAKGVITYKNHAPEPKEEDYDFSGNTYLSRTRSYERILNGADSYQDFIEKRQVEKTIRSLKTMHGNVYRINFIQYLKNRYEKGVEYDINRYPYNNAVWGRGFFSDLMLRMASGLTKEKYKKLLLEDDDYKKLKERYSQFEEEVFEDDVILAALSTFKLYIPGLSYDEVGADRYNEIMRKSRNELTEYEKEYVEVSEEFERNDPRNVMFDLLMDDVGYERGEEDPNPLTWFTDDEIREFIIDNLSPVNDEEKAINQELKAIIKELPDSMSYYSFPRTWKDNGLAELVLKIYDLTELA